MRNRHLTALALSLAVLSPGVAQAAEVNMNYNIDVGPLTVMVVKFTMDVTGGEVQARARIRSNGVSRVFSDYTATAEGEAKLGDGGPMPVVYRVQRENSDKRKETTVSWNGSKLTVDPPIGNAERAARIDRALAGDVSDPLTAILRMGTLGANPCPSVHQVFDGRDVFELALIDKGKGKLDDGDIDWKGEVQRCEVRWTPIAGRAKEKNEPGDSYDVAFAPVLKLDTGRALWLPVKMSGKIKGIGFKGYVEKLSDSGGD